MKFAKRVSSIQPSQTLAITSLVEKMRRQGKRVLALGAGEPDFDTPALIKEAGKAAISDGFTRYTSVSGLMDLREAICEKYEAQQAVTYKPSEVLVSCGAKHSIANLLLALCEEGDEVIVPAPYWTSYTELVRFTGASPVIVNTDEYTNFKLSTSQLEAAITPKTKLLMLNSPSNPTGAVYSKEELDALVEVSARHDFYIVFDEIYEKILYDGLKHAGLTAYPELRERAIIVNGVSKTYAMTGWRVGYMLASEVVIKACSKIQSHTTSNACSISQKASIAALKADDSILAEMLSAFNERRNFLVNVLNDIQGIECRMPQGAFYVFPNVSACFGLKFNGRPIETSVDFCAFMLEQANVAIVPGEAFGSTQHVRLSYAASLDTLKEAGAAMASAIKKLT